MAETKKVLMAVPTRGMVPMEWAMALRHLLIPEGVSLDVRGLAGLPIDDARNSFVQTAIDGDYDYLFFNDDDTVIPHMALTRLLERQLDVVSGLYSRRSRPIHPVMYKDGPGGEIRPVTKYGTGLMQVDYVGGGCLLISRKVLETLVYPWFFWGRNDPRLPKKDRLSEDMYFCRKAREAGFKIFMDASVRCLHVGLGKSEVENGRFVPADAVTDQNSFAVGALDESPAAEEAPKAAEPAAPATPDVAPEAPAE